MNDYLSQHLANEVRGLGLQIVGAREPEAELVESERQQTSEELKAGLRDIDVAAMDDKQFAEYVDILQANGRFTEYPSADELDEMEKEQLRDRIDRQIALLVAQAELSEEEAAGFYGGHVSLSRSGTYVKGHKGGPLDDASLDKIASMPGGEELVRRYKQDLVGDTGRERVVEFARRFVGFSEVGRNGGALVVLANGYEGDPYCAGGMNMVFDRVFGKDLFDQHDYLAARSFETVGAHFDALRENHSEAQPGDIITFHRSGGSGRHVGMITRNDNGQLYYLDFNGGNTVKEVPLTRTDVMAIVDTERLAQNKLGMGLDELSLDLVDEYTKEQEPLIAEEVDVDEALSASPTVADGERPRTKTHALT